METLKYTCVPSFTSMHCLHCLLVLEVKKQLWGKVPQGIFVDGCHGNNEIHMQARFHLHVHYSWQVLEVKK